MELDLDQLDNDCLDRLDDDFMGDDFDDLPSITLDDDWEH